MKPKFIILMGVSGCGKTTIGTALSNRLGWRFFDGDDFHPAENIAKMSKGIHLDDADRAAWLDKLHELIESCIQQDQPAVLACSALKERYRQRLGDGIPQAQIIYLNGSIELINARMLARKDHYMKPGMLESQFNDLEPPMEALTVDISSSVDEIVDKIMQDLFRKDER